MLFLSEVKKVVFSAVFVVFMAALIIMPVSQDAMNFSRVKLEEPVPGQTYGQKYEENPEMIMPAALNSLYSEFLYNNYVAYPIGYYKIVKLNEAKREQMAKIISSLTDISPEELLKRAEEKKSVEETVSEEADFAVHTPILEAVSLKADITYGAFVEAMQKADKLIGGGSSYEEKSLTRFCQAPVTYEEAMEQYRLTREEDRFTAGYARLFADYMIVGVMTLLPVFLAVALCLKDKRARMEELVFVRRAGAGRIVAVRYLAVVAAVMIPELILAYISNASAWGLYPEEALDYLAPLKYAVIWILPSVMTSVSVGMFFTELTGTSIAIAIQGLWWFFDSNQGIWERDGCALFRLIPRHNSLENTQGWIDHLDKFTANRILFTVMALLLLAGTVWIYSQRRRGKINGMQKITRNFRKLGNRKSKSQA
ncbi:MAG: hypothetical protein Q4D16_05515 [Eubacteriales bacterium]|nr:hypothetical protein [Eubacteriales bacterium]